MANRRSHPPSDELVGGELKLFFKLFGIRATKNCRCTQRACIMDWMGAEGCTNSMDTIVEWLREEAQQRRMIFYEAGARKAVRLCIKLAKRNSRSKYK